MSEERFLVTGAMGCIGTWIVRNLVKENTQVAVLDLSVEPLRMRLLMSQEEINKVQIIQGDVTDQISIESALEKIQATHIIHLAGLQVPYCQANPPLGAMVNVVGTINIFEAARQAGSQIQGLVYASSVAAMGSDNFYPKKPVEDDVPLRPDTLYGVYKQANEHTARVYWQDWGVSSVGLRPYIVYGVGRDQGLTSDITTAILAAAIHKPYQINFGGEVALQYADDVAKIFIASARAKYRGATVCNLRNDVVHVEDFVKVLKNLVPDAKISCKSERSLPFPADLEDANLRKLLPVIHHTELQSATQGTLEQFRILAKQGLVSIP